ncbi:MAG: DUF4124 domain-containing protein [Proteobacteria bacterium]|nr:DUF4124 domain-containing protein [Pseudomonadota bacterium]
MRISRCTANSLARGRALLAFVVLLALAAAAWWYFAPHTLPGFVQRNLPQSPTSNPPLYEWRDAQGHLHVTDVPPTDRPYKTVHFDPNANVLPKGVAPSK